MTALRCPSRLLLTLYVISYVSLIVPWHSQVAFGNSCCDQTTTAMSADNHPSATDRHDHSRCQICLTGGTIHTIPLHITFDTDRPLVGQITLALAMHWHGSTRQSTLSRAPPVVS